MVTVIRFPSFFRKMFEFLIIHNKSSYSIEWSLYSFCSFLKKLMKMQLTLKSSGGSKFWREKNYASLFCMCTARQERRSAFCVFANMSSKTTTEIVISNLDISFPLSKSGYWVRGLVRIATSLSRLSASIFRLFFNIRYFRPGKQMLKQLFKDLKTNAHQKIFKEKQSKFEFYMIRKKLGTINWATKNISWANDKDNSNWKRQKKAILFLKD